MKRVYKFIMSIFQPARAKDIADRFCVLSDSAAPVLHIGAFSWPYIKPSGKIIVLNLDLPESIINHSGIEFVGGDALRMPFSPMAFDLAFSNSVIEHLGGMRNSVSLP